MKLDYLTSGFFKENFHENNTISSFRYERERKDFDQHICSQDTVVASLLVLGQAPASAITSNIFLATYIYYQVPSDKMR